MYNMDNIKNMLDEIESYEDKTDILMQALEKLMKITSEIVNKYEIEKNELCIKIETINNENSLLKQLVEALKQNKN